MLSGREQEQFCQKKCSLRRNLLDNWIWATKGGILGGFSCAGRGLGSRSWQGSCEELWTGCLLDLRAFEEGAESAAVVELRLGPAAEGQARRVCIYFCAHWGGPESARVGLMNYYSIAAGIFDSIV